MTKIDGYLARVEDAVDAALRDLEEGERRDFLRALMMLAHDWHDHGGTERSLRRDGRT